MENIDLDMRSNKYDHFDRVKSALLTIEYQYFKRHHFGKNLEVLSAKNSRWLVTLYVRDKDLKKVMIFDWKKHNRELTKEQCLFVIKELYRINLGAFLTQKVMAEMLDVSTSSVQKYLSEMRDKGEITSNHTEEAVTI